MIHKKKLIEVALPLDAINKAAKAEKSVPRHGHPQTLHYWWARRPLATARAVIFSQMVDDPSGHPDLFPTEKAQEKERQRLFRIIEDLVLWENTTNKKVLQQARDEIWQSWRRTCAENADHPNAKELFDRHKLPAFHDPFAGGGALPLEAQRLGLESYASDLNPVAVLINKAMIEIPPKFAGKAPVNPETHKEKKLIKREWQGAQGLAEDVRYYGRWMLDEAKKRIGHLYPQIEITPELVEERPDLAKYKGRQLKIVAWIWARTVKSPNPAFADVDVPLTSTFILSIKKGKEAYVEPVIEGENYSFTVKVGKPKNFDAAKRGTKPGGSGSSFLCLMSGTPMPFEYLRCEAKAGGMGAKLMAVVAEGERGRVYLPPTVEMESLALGAKPQDVPETNLPKKALGFRVQEYGMTKWRDLFTSRQLVALTTFSDLVHEVRGKVIDDAKAVVWKDEETEGEGRDVTGYSEAVSLYLACVLSRLASYNNTICVWNMKGGSVAQIFSRQTVPMSWDYIEVNPLEKMSGNWAGGIGWVSDVLDSFTAEEVQGFAQQLDACQQKLSNSKLVCTDPPYYDNIGYADLSDFFYLWLRRSMKLVFPDIFATLTVPKVEELVATPYRHDDSKEKAETFFLDGMTQAMQRLTEQSHPAFPVTIYYAFKQSEDKSGSGIASTGWETFLDAVITSGFSICGTWPMRTERDSGVKASINVLASSIILVCRPKYPDASPATRPEFFRILKLELASAINYLQRGNIAPVDLAQAAIGPGMAVYTRYSQVLDAESKPLVVRDALELINQALDEILAEQEGDFDADSRWALTWFEQVGFAEGAFGIADVLARAKNTSVAGLVEAGIIKSARGQARLWKPSELPTDWNPDTDKRLTNWEMVHHLIRVLEADGESAASKIMAKLGSKAEVARELCYRLYTLCERKKRSAEALSYNGLVQSWPEIVRLAREGRKPRDEQTDLFDDNEE